MLNVYRDTWRLLTPPERKQLLSLIILMVFAGGFEVTGVASVLPFLETALQQDNNIRESDVESLAKLRPVFDRKHGSVTAANSTPYCRIDLSERLKAFSSRCDAGVWYTFKPMTS